MSRYTISSNKFQGPHNDKCVHDCVCCGDFSKISNQCSLGTSTQKNTQILENVLHLDAKFKMLKNTSFATHKYSKIPLPPPTPVICVSFLCLAPKMVLVENFTRVPTT